MKRHELIPEWVGANSAHSMTDTKKAEGGTMYIVYVSTDFLN